jgi:aminopeptidase N
MRKTLASGCLAALLCAPVSAQTPKRVVLPPGVTPTHYDIVFTPDAEHETFAGSAKIDLTVAVATRTITLNSLDLALHAVRLSGGVSPAVSFNTDRQTATLTCPEPLSPGNYTLTIDYTGKINPNAAGLFRLDYDNQGKHQRALFTQFENSDARRFVPCWDEPNKKATFTLTATVPADEMALSNMPVAETTTTVNATHRVRFAETPKMSPYLLFFGLGDFERISKIVQGVDVGVVVKRGDRQRGLYALDAAEKLLPYYNEYFGYKYPLPKMDLIAAPGASPFFSAMENWGALLFFERSLLVDPRLTVLSDQQNVYTTIAHEMAHQWFGDLVTMDWWEDLWLNEGFASWIEVKSTDRFHPEWHLPLVRLISKQSAMELDGRVGTHPVIQPIADVLEANNAFDNITYLKGSSIITMLEAFVGPDVFRAGVRNYIRKYAFGNTVTDDLWKELDAVSPRKVTRIAHDFTLQPGVPMVRAQSLAGSVLMTQDRFGMDKPSRAPRRWEVPVVAKRLGNEAPIPITLRGTARLASPGSEPLLINAGQSGYFRTDYGPKLFAALMEQYAKLSSADQLGLLNDTGALAEAGYQPVADLLNLLPRVKAGLDPIIVSAMVVRLSSLDSLEEGLPGQKAFRAYGRKLLQPILSVVGWDAKPGESDNTLDLRDAVLERLALFGDEAVLVEARRRFQLYRANPDSLPASTRRTVLSIVATHADAATWDELHELARHPRSPLEKEELYELLGAAIDPAVAARALPLAFSSEVESSVGPQILSSVGNRHPELAFDYALSHLEQLNARMEPDSRAQFLPAIVAHSHDPKLLVKLQAYAEKNIPASGRVPVVQADSAVKLTLELRSRCIPQVDACLKGSS